MNVSTSSQKALQQIRRNLSNNQRSLTKATKKIAEGKRITQAADDAAGLSIASQMRSDQVSQEQVSRNIGDAMSLLHTAESSISTQIDIVVRLRELQIQSMNDTNSTDITAIQNEMIAMFKEYSQISATSNFNRQNLLNSADTLSFQVGIGKEDKITLNLETIRTDTLSSNLGEMLIAKGYVENGFAFGIGLPGPVATLLRNQTLEYLDNSINALTSIRSNLGGIFNRFEAALSESQNKSTSLAASRSTIEDADIASEVTNQTQLMIQQNAGTAALSQAKSISQSILSLLN